eukprot:jgi/Mesvir1/8492/Mv12255-RA.1
MTCDLLRKCHYSPNGCPATGTHANLRTHAATCGFKKLACPNRAYGCTEMVYRKDVGVHKSECRYFPCKYFLENDGCRITSPLAAIKEHEETCPFGVYPCINLINNVRKKMGMWTTCNDNNMLRWNLCEQGKSFFPLPCQCGCAESETCTLSIND